MLSASYTRNLGGLCGEDSRFFTTGSAKRDHGPAPAVSNAVFNATGAQARCMPRTAEGVPGESKAHKLSSLFGNYSIHLS